MAWTLTDAEEGIGVDMETGYGSEWKPVCGTALNKPKKIVGPRAKRLDHPVEHRVLVCEGCRCEIPQVCVQDRYGEWRCADRKTCLARIQASVKAYEEKKRAKAQAEGRPGLVTGN